MFEAHFPISTRHSSLFASAPSCLRAYLTLSHFKVMITKVRNQTGARAHLRRFLAEDTKVRVAPSGT